MLWACIGRSLVLRWTLRAGLRISCWFSTDNCAQRLHRFHGFKTQLKGLLNYIAFGCSIRHHNSHESCPLKKLHLIALQICWSSSLLAVILHRSQFRFWIRFCWNGFNWRTVICVADEWFGFTCKLPRHKQRFRFDIAKYRLQTKRARHENHRIANEP